MGHLPETAPRPETGLVQGGQRVDGLLHPRSVQVRAGLGDGFVGPSDDGGCA
jgi:hypothetical protein